MSLRKKKTLTMEVLNQKTWWNARQEIVSPEFFAYQTLDTLLRTTDRIPEMVTSQVFSMTSSTFWTGSHALRRNRERFRRTYSKSYRPLEKPALTQVYYCTPCLLKFIPQPGRLCTRKFTAPVNRVKCKTAGFWLGLQAKDRHRLWLGVFSQGHWHRMCFQGVFILNKESLYSLRKLLGRKLNLVLLLFRLTLTLAVLLPPPGLG